MTEVGSGDPGTAAPPDSDRQVQLSEQLTEAVAEALEQGDPERAASLATPLHAADQADLLEQLGRDDRAALVAQLESELNPELLSYLDENVRGEVLEQLGPTQAGAAIAQLETDDAIEILEDLDPAEQMALLETLPMPERAAVEAGLAYPEESAGRLMQRDFVAAPEFWTVGQAIDYLRSSPDLPDDFYDLYIINPRYEPVGSVPLSKVLRSRRGVLLTELKLKDLHLIPVDLDQEKVAFMFRQYGLVSAPVVGANGRMLGVITVDDVVHVLEEEAEEDILKLGGVQETSIFVSPWRASRQRVPWLLMSLVSSTLSASVIYHFNHSIEQLVALAVLMPVIAALGGNAGVQTLAVVVRALAVRELTRGNAPTVLLKEIGVGVLNGSAVMFVGALVALIWFGKFDLALVFAVSVVATISAAAV
ncbi:MAG TPA: magnesium transporter, partial [Geminicoccaceae bacterium]|nr:magnesium transporter [Geminicoccaceae bacterium]